MSESVFFQTRGNFLFREPIVNIVYLSDASSAGGDSTNDKERHFQVVCAVIIKHDLFPELEEFFGAMAEYLPEDGQDGTGEVHAMDMLKGEVVSSYGIPVVYGAIDRHRLSETVFSTADPIDMAFRRCAEGIEKWFGEQAPDERGILIADERDEWKSAVYKAFRRGRPAMPAAHNGQNGNGRKPLSHINDDMYFADSNASKGIQLANICGRAIFSHLTGGPDDGELYASIENQVYFSTVGP
jgi:hypothetical protein